LSSFLRVILSDIYGGHTSKSPPIAPSGIAGHALELELVEGTIANEELDDSDEGVLSDD
jgi:hypothetical protein